MIQKGTNLIPGKTRKQAKSLLFTCQHPQLQRDHATQFVWKVYIGSTEVFSFLI